ncbi:unnamed protein product [Pocillopora meandrina]|uniref:Uncharacterized protein n=1 Tax=Pocillopora meandrina TaxID=46732 RepID=A0AAU9Y1G6_9CNID|nr:unnamed protein product [Pocillopora meandrina]
MGRAELSVNVSVKVPAKFITEPKRSITAYKTWDTVLQCDIFGYPSPVITWTRSGEQLSVNRHFSNGSQLMIQNTTEDDAGAYVCQGTNQMANVMRVIWVIVKVVVNPYMVSSPPGEIKVQHVGDTVTLNCSAGGSPLPKVMWFKGGLRINSRAMNDGKYLISSEVIIHRFKPSDSGLYLCRFYNDKNVTAESNTDMTLVNCGDPGSPSNGRKHGSRYWTGESVSYVCDPQYHLAGPAIRMCLPSGSWSGLQPSCKLFSNFKLSAESIKGIGIGFALLCSVIDPGYWLIGSQHQIGIAHWVKILGVKRACLSKSVLLTIGIQCIIPSYDLFQSLLRFLDSNSYKRWTLCYRASSHGWAASTFHSRCDGKPHTVTIIRKSPYVFGGYTDIAWGKKIGLFRE